VNVWDVKLVVSEQDGHALAQATLYADQEITRGSGQAFAAGDDREENGAAAKLAVGRALLDLVSVLLRSAEEDMRASQCGVLGARVSPN
jgi:hypothetical protein